MRSHRCEPHTGEKVWLSLECSGNCEYFSAEGSIPPSATFNRVFAKNEKFDLTMKVDPVKSPMYSSFHAQASCLLKAQSTSQRKHTVKALVHHNSRVEKR